MTAIENGVLSLSSHAQLRVERGQLHIEHGWPEAPADHDHDYGPIHETLTFSRVAGIKRLILPLIGYGTISYDVLRWLRSVGSELIVTDHGGDPILITIPLHSDLPELRRRQALIADDDAGLALTRNLLERKMAGQALTLYADIRPESLAIAARSAATAIATTIDALGRCTTFEQLRIVEARASAIEWDIIEHTPVRFARAQEVPAHWTVAGQRHSVLTNSPKQACSPAHCILNYALGIARGELHQACISAGLDPSLAIMHSDRERALLDDLIEPLRPKIERWWLDFLHTHTLNKRDFAELPSGEVRLMPRLRQELGRTVALWRVPAVELAGWLAAELGSRRPERALRGRGWSPTLRKVRRQPVVEHLTVSVPAPITVPLALPRLCAHCSQVQLPPNSPHDFCSPECATSASTLAALAEQLQDVRYCTPAAWQQLWPCLQRVPLPRLCQETGISKPWASMIRSGRRVPAARLWPLLCNAGTVQVPVRGNPA